MLLQTLANKKRGGSGDSRNFVQGVPISLWKNFGSFRSISSVLGRFGKYRPKFKIWLAWSLCLKKKKVLKTKAKLHSVHRKTSKGKKKMKRKEMNKCNRTINYKFIWNINKIINYCCLVVSLICLSFINYNYKICCFMNYKIINCYLV